MQWQILFLLTVTILASCDTNIPLQSDHTYADRTIGVPEIFASAFGGQPTKIYEAFQWKNLSMRVFSLTKK